MHPSRCLPLMPPHDAQMRSPVCSNAISRVLPELFRMWVYLHASNRVRADLSGFVSGPILYGDAEIPRALTEEQVKAVLDCTRSDRSPKGLRDYAMLLMLATYGLRAGEVVWLSLQDISWKEE